MKASGPSIRDTKWGAHGQTWMQETYQCTRLYSSTVCHNDTFLKVKVIHLQMDNMVALYYVKQIEGTQNKVLSGLTKKIWDYLLL